MHIVIVGAGYGGMSCALRLARRAGPRVRITLVNERETFVERIRLHERAAGGRPGLRDLRTLLRGTGIELVVGRATSIDARARAIVVGDRRIEWDRLVLALGSTTDRRSVPGVAEHTYGLDLAASQALADVMPTIAAQRGRVVVVGGGLTGIETATELAETHREARVTLLTSAPIGDGWSPSAREHVLAAFARLNIELHEGVRIERVERGRVQGPRATFAFDACVWSAGFAFPSLAREAGLEVDDRGRVRVDAALRSVSHPRIHAAGDIATPSEAAGPPWPMGCKSAEPSGAHLGDNLARAARGQLERPFLYRAPAYCVSLGRRDGLLQFTAADGAPTGRVLTGRMAATFKEIICKGTMWALALERMGLLGIPQVAPNATAALPAAEREAARA